jgi:hypothetical protein
MSRALAVAVAAAILGASVGVALVAAWATVGAPTQCVPSQPITTLETLTPALIVNSPYGGHANGTLTVYDNGSSGWRITRWTAGASNGSVEYVFDRVNWTIWTTQRVGEPTGSCAGVFAYSETTGPTYSVSLTSPEDYPNDALAPRVSGDNSPINSSGGPYADLYFNDSFSSSDSFGKVSTCGGLGARADAWSSYVDFQVPFDFQGSTHVVSITVQELTNYSYSFPPNGSWAEEDLSAAGGPGGGYSFAYLQACP